MTTSNNRWQLHGSCLGRVSLYLISLLLVSFSTQAAELQAPIIAASNESTTLLRVPSILFGCFLGVAFTAAAMAFTYRRLRYILQASYVGFSAWPVVLLTFFGFSNNTALAQHICTVMLFGLSITWISYFRLRHSFSSTESTVIRDYIPVALLFICTITTLVSLSKGSYLYALAAHVIIVASIGLVLLYQYFFAATDNFSLFLGIEKLAHCFGLAALTQMQLQEYVSYSSGFMAIGVINLIDMAITLPLITLAAIKRSQQLVARSLTAARKEAHVAAIEPLLNRARHDLRGPISDIIGLSELVTETPLNQQQRTYMTDIQRSARSALNKMNTFFLFQNPSSRHSAEFSHKEPINIYHIISECAAYYAHYAERQSAEVITDIDDDVAEYWHGNPHGVRQILMHLLDQLLVSNNASVVVIKVSTDPTQQLMIRVSHESKREQSQPSSDQASNLHIAMRLVSELGGDTFQHGTNPTPDISLYLPFHALPNKNKALDDDSVLTGRRILIVDDNTTSCEILSQHARRWGMEVHTAGNYHETLAVMHHQTLIDQAIDIVLLDYIMPGKNGLDIARDIHLDPKIQHGFFTVMMTSATPDIQLQATAEHGIRRLLEKPVLAQTLKQTLYEEVSLPQRLRAHHAEQQHQAALQNANVHALVVEDEPISRTVVNSMLKKLGVTCTLCTNGNDAIARLTDPEQHFDIVLLDCELPGENGYTVTQRRREWEANNASANIPIIAMTAHDSSDAIERSLAAGMDAHSSKPIDLKHLEQLIRQLLSIAP